MTPQDLGFPPFFTDFRPAQEEAISHVLCSSSQYVGIGAPPGCGKSGIAMALAKLLPGRTTILTGTLGLQDQYAKRFASMGLTDMRGRSHYSCWEGGTCEDGGRLGCGDRAGCPYLGAFAAWQAAPVNETSYAFWLAHPTPVRSLPDTLILDEADVAGEWLSRSLDIHLTQEECARARIKVTGNPREQMDIWMKITPRLVEQAAEYYDEIKRTCRDERSPARREKLWRELRHAANLLERVQRLRLLTETNWVIEQVDDRDRRTWKFECVWPGAYHWSLFRNVPRVVLMSATLRPKTLHLLGLGRADYDFREWGRQFPAINGPVLHVPSVRMNARATPEDDRIWLETIDRIIDLYPHQKGLIHTVSYARARQIINGSRHRSSNRLVWNDNLDPKSPRAAQIFELFEKMDPAKGNVLVSPSFSTGWDFAGDRAEYQIIAKVPIPDTRSKVMQARCEKDRDYPMYLAAQELVQGCGRINRDEHDRGTTYIVDDSIKWFMHVAKLHMPRWFKVRSLAQGEALPRPLQKVA